MKTRNFSQKLFTSQNPVPTLLGLILLVFFTIVQLPAQTPTCTLVLDAAVSNVQCQDNGSADENDDTFTFTLTVTGGNPWGWSGGGLAMGDYGVAYTFGPYLISAGPVSFTVVDMDNPTCTVDVNVNPPDPCSPGAFPGSIGDFVWSDSNSNGIQEAGEPGIEGVYVILYDAGMAVIDSKITDANGAYNFTNIMPGTYKIKFANPGGLEPSPQDAGGNDDTDSDQDLLGFTDLFTLASEQVITNIDGGFQAIPQPTCDIMVEVVSVDCNTDGTFTFTAVVTGGNPWGWSGGGIAMGNYGEPTVFGPFPIGGGTVTITLTDMDNPTCTETFSVEPCESPCENVTDAGEIGNDESRCGPYDPAEIVELVPPSGGSGELEYMWLKSTEGCMPADFRFMISGANEATYDPGTILQTTWFRRCVRRAGCPWVDNGCVVKTVTSDCPTGSCETRRVSDATSCSDEAEFAMLTRDFITGIANESDLYHLRYAQMIEQNNGNARIMAQFINNANTSLAFEIDVTFTGRTTEGSSTPSDCYEIDDSDWHYYAGVNGELTGLRALTGSRIRLNSSQDFQLGTGANLQDFAAYGASIAFDLTVLSQPSSSIWINGQDAAMSMHLRLDGGTPACEDVLMQEVENRSGDITSTPLSSDFELSPNPASQKIRLDLTQYQDQNIELSLFNHLGEQVKWQHTPQVQRAYHEWNISDLSAGLYFVQIQIKGQEPLTKRLIIAK